MRKLGKRGSTFVVAADDVVAEQGFGDTIFVKYNNRTCQMIGEPFMGDGCIESRDWDGKWYVRLILVTNNLEDFVYDINDMVSVPHWRLKGEFMNIPAKDHKAMKELNLKTEQSMFFGEKYIMGVDPYDDYTEEEPTPARIYTREVHNGREFIITKTW